MDKYFKINQRIIASGRAYIAKDESVVWQPNDNDDDPILKSLSHLWKGQDGVFTLFIEFGLWDATYTLQSNNKWLLTKRGQGYA